MRKQELAALKLNKAAWQSVLDLMPAVFATVGITEDEAGRDGSCRIYDHGERGCVVLVENADLAQRMARAFAPRLSTNVPGYSVTGTNAGTSFRFRTSAFEASPDGSIRDASGVELDLEDTKQDWGGGALGSRARRVLRDFGALPIQVVQERLIGFKRRSGGKPSSPRVASLMTILKKARAWEGVSQDGGRYELRVELAAGGRQSSFCSAAEFEELKKLIGRG